MTAIAVGVAIAIGAGYWIAHLQNAGNPVPLITESQAQSDSAAPADGERKILYYRNPMGLPDTSPVPKKDSMGMDYIPVYADDRPDGSGAVAVSPARIQTLGVKTALVELRTVDAAVRASGRIEIDERRQVVVAPRFEGWIERLHVNAVGDPVKKGQPLFTAYSPELQSTGEELRICRFQKTAALNVRSRLHYSSKGGLDPSGNEGREPTITYRSIDVSQRTALCGRVAAANGASVGLAQATQLVAVSSAAYPRHFGAQQGSATTFPSIEAQRTMVR